jgi:hypothetical protein
MWAWIVTMSRACAGPVDIRQASGVVRLEVKRDDILATGSASMTHDLPPGFVALLPHPLVPETGVRSLAGRVAREGNRLRFSYALRGDLDRVRVPRPGPPVFVRGLWETTCFEAFLADDPGYVERNFAPSGAWAAFRFDGYRLGMASLDRATDAPQIETRSARGSLDLDAWVTMGPDGFPDRAPARAGLCAVIEAVDGTRAYWAAAHADPGRPDFHRVESFIVPILDHAA